MKPTLVVLAAGMGSRYGGLKQIDPMGPSGETILDYSVFDCLRAGFGKVVFIIRPDFEAAFRDRVVSRFAGQIDTALAFQTLDRLPPGFTLPAGREKPWGTTHAILCARDAVTTPFAVINADDFYGRDSFAVLGRRLAGQPVDSTAYSMVGFTLKNTLSDHGTVTGASAGPIPVAFSPTFRNSAACISQARVSNVRGQTGRSRSRATSRCR